MSHIITGRPDSTEHAPYYGRYIQLVQESDILSAMAHQREHTFKFFRALPDSIGSKRYAPGKWSVNEVIGHICDTERVFAYRALWFARSAPGALPGFEQDDWIKSAAFGSQKLEDLIMEFDFVRRASMSLFSQLTEEAWNRRGVASNCEFTVRAAAYMIVGHERHHLEILKTKYL
jgi:hypothetical protein